MLPVMLQKVRKRIGVIGFQPREKVIKGKSTFTGHFGRDQTGDIVTKLKGRRFWLDLDI